MPATFVRDARRRLDHALRRVRSVVTGGLEIARANKVIGSSLEASPRLYISDAQLRSVVQGLDLAEICITSGIEVSDQSGPADCFRIAGIEGVGVEVIRAAGQKCARSWKYFDPKTANPDYPDVTPRDAQALVELKAAGRLA